MEGNTATALSSHAITAAEFAEGATGVTNADEMFTSLMYAQSGAELGFVPSEEPAGDDDGEGEDYGDEEATDEAEEAVDEAVEDLEAAEESVEEAVEAVKEV